MVKTRKIYNMTGELDNVQSLRRYPATRCGVISGITDLGKTGRALETRTAWITQADMVQGA